MKQKYPSLTKTAKTLWKEMYGYPMPKGWKVEYAGFMRGAVGLCLYRQKKILISKGDVKKYNIVATLAHEFVHVMNPNLRHGKEFTQLENRNLRKVWPDA